MNSLTRRSIFGGLGAAAILGASLRATAKAPPAAGLGGPYYLVLTEQEPWQAEVVGVYLDEREAQEVVGRLDRAYGAHDLWVFSVPGVRYDCTTSLVGRKEAEEFWNRQKHLWTAGVGGPPIPVELRPRKAIVYRCNSVLGAANHACMYAKGPQQDDWAGGFLGPVEDHIHTYTSCI